MPLFVCPDCKQQISEKAKACPQCGLPDPFNDHQMYESVSEREVDTHSYYCAACNKSGEVYETKKSSSGALQAKCKDCSILVPVVKHIGKSKETVWAHTKTKALKSTFTKIDLKKEDEKSAAAKRKEIGIAAISLFLLLLLLLLTS